MKVSSGLKKRLNGCCSDGYIGQIFDEVTKMEFNEYKPAKEVEAIDAAIFAIAFAMLPLALIIAGMLD